ncbi:phosphotransferase, partial [Escherichia coli]|nr:phosphotransferase [Escherichia coli]
ETLGSARALAAFRLEKAIALGRYRRWRAELAGRGASPAVLERLDRLIDSWRTALAGSAEALYLREAWRSHRLDLADDLDGQTCTPQTL